MARGKYERKIINTHLENFQEQLERGYSQYQEGAYVPIIYYQVDRSKSQVDQALDVAQNIIGTSSSRKYKKIVGVPLYGLASGLNYEIELSETAFKTLTASSGYFTPGTITPSADDFFTIDRQGLRNHLFKITSTDFNTANINKYYQVNFELYQNPSSDIINNVIEEYKFVIENMGSNQNTIIKAADEYLMTVAQETADTLIDKYIFSFYDFNYDTFTLKANSSGLSGTKLWNPYLIRFLHQYELLNKYNYDLMTEVYVPEYMEGTYPKWFKDDVWMDSIYNKIATKTQIREIDLFTTIDYSTSLTKWVKLPFYQSSENILLDSFANDYVNNFSTIPVNEVLRLPDNFKESMINLKSIFEKDVIEKNNSSKNYYLEDKYLYELEYFSQNAHEIWNNSKIGEIYFVYNKNNKFIDNIYKISTVPGEVAPGPDEDLLESNRWFQFQWNFKDQNLNKSLYFFDEEGNISSVWKVLEDKSKNKYIGRLDGTLFNKGNYVIENTTIDFIRDYINNRELKLTEEDLKYFRNLNIRRDSAEMFYLVPIVIFILKKFINKIQN